MAFRNLVILLILAGVGAAGYFLFKSESGPVPGESCTLEALVCPDGSSVGRVPPDCEFAACPSAGVDTAAWKVSSNPGVGSFKYPERFPGRYLSAPDWPPVLSLDESTFSCTEAGALEERAGRTVRKVIGGNEYCVTERREGAAGSVYSLLAYAFPKGQGTAILTFSVRAPQCANYGTTEREECEAERGTIDVDGLLDAIAQTVALDAEGTPSSYKDWIRVESPLPESEVASPLTVKGEARGSWFFEGSFPVVLVDWDGRIIGESQAKAEGEWMTEEYVPFTARLEFSADTSVSDRGAIILRKDNPSGLPQNDDAFEYTVFFKK